MISPFRISLMIVLISSLLAACASPVPTVAPTATMFPTPTPAPTIQPGDVERQVMVKDVERSYLLHIPPGLDSLHLVPVVFAFHGGGADEATMQILTGFNEIADRSMFLVVYPKGLGQWNVGNGCCEYAGAEDVDEISFIQEILSDLGKIAGVDPKRIYATGFSSGAALAYRLACEMSDIFAAIAPVAGTLMYSPCEPKQPVSLIHVHGLADMVVPYAGGGEFAVLPLEQIIEIWAQLNGCTGSPQIDKKNDLITHTAYTSCDAEIGVELYTLKVGRHQWPSKYVWPASQIIWDFFAAHPKP